MQIKIITTKFDPVTEQFDDEELMNFVREKENPNTRKKPKPIH